MTVITITRNAKCKDCKYVDGFLNGKLWRYRCSNPSSKNYTPKYWSSKIRKNDFVCDNWEL